MPSLRMPSWRTPPTTARPLALVPPIRTAGREPCLSVLRTSAPLSPSSPVYALGPLPDFFAADPNLRTPYVQNFNLNIQQGLSSKAVVQVGYVGTKGTKLFRFRDINQPSQAQITAADLANGVQSYGVPRTNFPNLFYVNQQESTASSIYHSLQTSLRLSGWHGFTSIANFVWSHSTDDASDSEDFIPNAAQPQDSTRPHLDRGNSNFDIRRRFSWNLTYELPKMGSSKFTNGWGFDSVVSLQDGQPFSFNLQLRRRLLGRGRRFRPAGCGRPHPIRQRALQLHQPDIVPDAVHHDAGHDRRCRHQLHSRNTPLRQPGPGRLARSGVQGVELLGLQEHGPYGAAEHAAPRRVL